MGRWRDRVTRGRRDREIRVSGYQDIRRSEHQGAEIRKFFECEVRSLKREIGRWGDGVTRR